MKLTASTSNRKNNSLQVKKTHKMRILSQTIFMIDTSYGDRDVDGLIHWPHIVPAEEGSSLI